MDAPLERAGSKTNCLGCGQRLQIPPVERAKTILAISAAQAAPQPPTGFVERVWGSGRFRLGAIVLVGLFALVGICALGVSVVRWLTGGQIPQATAALEAAKKVAGDAPKDDMTFQQLEDRLNAGGLRVSRVASRRVKNAMWFGNGLRDQHPGIVDAWEEVGELYRIGCIRATKCPDSKQAMESAAKVADVQQRPAFAWGPFVFEGKNEVLDNVKVALSK
jgi:hypothetical protein